MHPAILLMLIEVIFFLYFGGSCTAPSERGVVGLVVIEKNEGMRCPKCEEQHKQNKDALADATGICSIELSGLSFLRPDKI